LLNFKVIFANSLKVVIYWLSQSVWKQLKVHTLSNFGQPSKIVTYKHPSYCFKNTFSIFKKILKNSRYYLTENKPKNWKAVILSKKDNGCIVENGFFNQLKNNQSSNSFYLSSVRILFSVNKVAKLRSSFQNKFNVSLKKLLSSALKLGSSKSVRFDLNFWCS